MVENLNHYGNVREIYKSYIECYLPYEEHSYNLVETFLQLQECLINMGEGPSPMVALLDIAVAIRPGKLESKSATKVF